MSGADARVYRSLQQLARKQGRGTQELLELYVHERFLARLASSPYRDRFVLKGGLLLTVHAIRRATRDADLLARAWDDDPDGMRKAIAEIADIEMDDGLEFDSGATRARAIREEGAHAGLRVTAPARSGHAAAVAAGRIFAFGGEELVAGGQTIAAVEALRPGGRWSVAGLPPMRTPRHGLGGAGYRGSVYAVEGGPTPGFSFSDALEALRVKRPRR